MIQLKRAYDSVEESDGCRVLVDRLWPRGISKEDLKLTAWIKEIAPSDELRQWFEHDPEKFKEFQKRYFAELKRNEEPLRELQRLSNNCDRLTLVYGAKDREHNNAVALKEYLQTKANF